MRRCLLLASCLWLAGCSKSDDPVATSQDETTTTNPPAKTACLGATTPLEVDGRIGTRSYDVKIANFSAECGDSLRVFMRRDVTQNYYEIFPTTFTSINYYRLAGNTVTLFNNASVYQDWRIDAILK